MENLTSVDWTKIWYNSITIISIMLVLRLLLSRASIKVANGFLIFLAAIIMLYVVNEPSWEYSDKWNYQVSFENILDASIERKDGDSGFYIFTKGIRLLTDWYILYFLLIGGIYFYGYLKFINHFFSKEYRFIVFFTTISALGFYAYATNTIRQGLALAIFLLAIVYMNNKVKSIVFSIIAVLFHKSLIIPVAVFWIVKRYNLNNNFIYFWLLCLVVTILLGSSLGVLLGDFLVSSDNRMDGYLNDENESYQAGFKLNFLIYSIAPIIYGMKMKVKINDEFYNQILSLYIIVNAVWLLMIRIAFTDRFAYLSWFLIPFIFLYPLSKQQLFKNQNHIIALILFYLTMVTYLIAS